MSLETFLSNFYAENGKIQSSIESLSRVVETESESDRKTRLSLECEQISASLDKLQKYFNDNSSTIPLYEVRKAQESMAKLSKTYQERRDQVFPKKKFGFRSKQNMTNLETALVDTIAKSDSAKSVESTSVADTISKCSCTIKDVKGEKNLVKLESEIKQQDVALVNIQDSVIQLRCNPSVVYLSNIRSSVILIGPVTGSAFISNCHDSKIVIACHQLRIHDSQQVDFYINVASRAIIENCNELHFAPYTWSYPELDKHAQLSSISFSNINWRLIDDFNWLSQTEKSPHWSFLDENKTLKWKTNEQNELIES